MYLGEGGTHRVQVLVCPTPEEGTSIFSKEATASALAISSEQQSAFAKDGDPLAQFMEVLVIDSLCGVTSSWKIILSILSIQ